jgi:hypothetical protein
MEGRRLRLTAARSCPSRGLQFATLWLARRGQLIWQPADPESGPHDQLAPAPSVSTWLLLPAARLTVYRYGSLPMTCQKHKQASQHCQ